MSGRLPPHDLDAEAAVLGAMMLGPAIGVDVCGQVSDDLLPGDFYKPAHQHIAKAIGDICERGDPLNTITVADELARTGLLDQAGGIEALHQLQNDTPPVSHVTKHVEIVQRHARHRRQITLAADLTAAAYDGDETRARRAREELDALAHPTDTGLTVESLPDPFEVPPLDWHAQGLLVKTTHGQLAGPEKSLKSYLGDTIDIGLASGLPILGRWEVPHPQRVLTFVGEGGRNAYLRRIQRICTAYRISVDDVRPNLRFSFDTAAASSDRFTDTLTRQLDDFQPDLVRIDPWYAFAPDDTDARNLYETGAALERLAQQVCCGTSLLINNHFNQTGTGTKLQRISMAGHAEWCDSWLLVGHRTPPDVANGHFHLRLDVGSRQWGGGSFDVDYDIGRFDHEHNIHVGLIRWAVTTAHEPSDAGDTDAKVAAVKAEIVAAWKRRRGKHRNDPLSKDAWLGPIKGDKYIKAAAWQDLLDDGRIEEVPVVVTDTMGRNQPRTHFRLVESAHERDEK